MNQRVGVIRVEVRRANQAIVRIVGVSPVGADEVSRHAQLVAEYAHIVVVAARGQRQMVSLLNQLSEHLHGAVM